MKPTATRTASGWDDAVARRKAERIALYAKIKEMYLAGMTTRAIGREVGLSASGIGWALKASGVKPRPRGGLNNPRGYNGRWELNTLRPVEPRGQEDRRRTSLSE